jgi:hypothetical protein
MDGFTACKFAPTPENVARIAEVIEGFQSTEDMNSETLSIDEISGTASVEINVRIDKVKGLVVPMLIPIFKAVRRQDYAGGFTVW